MIEKQRECPTTSSLTLGTIKVKTNKRDISQGCWSSATLSFFLSSKVFSFFFYYLQFIVTWSDVFLYNTDIYIYISSSWAWVWTKQQQQKVNVLACGRFPYWMIRWATAVQSSFYKGPFFSQRVRAAAEDDVTEKHQKNAWFAPGVSVVMLVVPSKGNGPRDSPVRFLCQSQGPCGTPSWASSVYPSFYFLNYLIILYNFSMLKEEEKEFRDVHR